MPEHAREPASPVAEQQHTLAGIHPVILHSHRKKVLAEEHVLISVAVEVGHGRAVDRRELRLDRQRPGFKCPGAIEQQHRGEVRRLEQFGPGQLTGENLLKRRSGVTTMRREVFAQKREQQLECHQLVTRQQSLRCHVEPRLERIVKTVAADVAVDEVRHPFFTVLVRAVQPPIAGEQIEPAVVVEVADGERLPNARLRVKPPRLCRVGEFAAAVFENTDRPPLGRQRQFRQNIVVQIHEHGSGHEADVRENGGLFGVEFHSARAAAQQPRRGGLRELAGDAVTGDEHVGMPVAVHVSHGDRAGIGVVGGRQLDDFRLGRTGAEELQRRGSRRGRIVRGHRHEQPLSKRTQAKRVTGERSVKRRFGELGQAAFGGDAVADKFPTRAVTEEQFVAPVAIPVDERHAGAGLSEAAGQQRLSQKIVGRMFAVFMVEPVACVDEHRRRLGQGRRLGLAIFLVDFVGVIRLGRGDDGSAAAWPSDLDREALRLAGGEAAERLITGEVAAAGDHFLRLLIRPAANDDARSNAACVTPRAA